MIFYQTETLLGLALASLPAIVGTFLFFFSDRKRLAFALVILTAFSLRLVMISLDPYLHDWDEKFHALVAKNMTSNPFKPILIVDNVWEDQMVHWCCSHVWLHKQPLFLWQMALSLKLFGFNEIALRLPSALLGTIGVYFVREIAVFWTKNKEIAFLAALLMCFSYFQLELTAGRESTDHNDIAFIFYVTASFWAFIRYLKSNYSIRWAVYIGIFAGCAILIKWLTGLLVFGVWGLYILLTKKERFNTKQYLKLALGLLTAIAIFLPWQLYISYAFPIESAREYALNTEHIFKVVEGHHGDMFFHFLQLETLYGYLPYLIIPGILFLFFNKRISKPLSFAFIAAILVIFSFFSLIVATKMPAFTLPVSSLLFIIIAIGIISSLNRLKDYASSKFLVSLIVLFSFIAILQVFQPFKIAERRSISRQSRNIDIHNTLIYKSLNEDLLDNCVLFNTKCDDALDIMFYKNTSALCYFPKESELDSLKVMGRKLIRFKNIYNLNLPVYLTKDSSIVILDYDILIPEKK
jgi:4-amino-4-deoxy-L-arabinose transferase-like glycosyltransferase